MWYHALCLIIKHSQYAFIAPMQEHIPAVLFKLSVYLPLKLSICLTIALPFCLSAALPAASEITHTTTTNPMNNNKKQQQCDSLSSCQLSAKQCVTVWACIYIHTCLDHTGRVCCVIIILAQLLFFKSWTCFYIGDLWNNKNHTISEKCSVVAEKCEMPSLKSVFGFVHSGLL